MATQDADYASVVGDSGLSGYIVGPSETNPDEVVIARDDGSEISVPASALRREADGSWRLDDMGVPAGAATQDVVPVLAEELDIQRRKRVTGKVLIGKHTTERDETVSMPLRRERAQVRRVIIDRPVESAPPVRREGDTIIFPIVEEVAVVQKRLVLKEELHVSRRRTVEQHEEIVTLREEHPSVQRFDANGQAVTDVPDRPPLVERETGDERGILDPGVSRPSLLGPAPDRRPVRQNKILRED